MDLRALSSETRSPCFLRSGNVFRIINTGPMEYPLTASIVRPSLDDFGIPKLRWNAKA